MSASARKRIAAAQKARWAKWHQQHGQNNQKATPKRVVSIASRRKMAAAQRARWPTGRRPRSSVPCFANRDCWDEAEEDQLLRTSKMDVRVGVLTVIARN